MAALTCCNVVLGDEPVKKVPGLGDPGKLISLKIETGRAKDGVISLAGRDAAQQLIIIGVYDSGQTRDLTGKVAYTSEPAGIVAIDASGYVTPTQEGQARVTATMSEAVTVTGTPQLTLNVGGTDRIASYASGSGSSALVFTYTIQTGDTDGNGIAIAANSLANVVDSTIADAAGNAATLSHAAVSDNTAYLVDTTAPIAPVLTLGTGVSGGATSAEATQGSGVVTVSGESGASVTVVFTRGEKSVTKTLIGTGSAQGVVLSAGDVTTLGDGLIGVSATATDAANNTSEFSPTVGITGVPALTIQPAVPPSISISWLVTNSFGGTWQLMQASNLTPPVAWFNVAGSPNVTSNGTWFTLPVSTTNATRFFRLQFQ